MIKFKNKYFFNKTCIKKYFQMRGEDLVSYCYLSEEEEDDGIDR